MKKYKSLLIGTLVLSAILIDPVTSFAQSNNNGKGHDEEKEERKEERMEFKRDYKKDFHWGRFQSWVNKNKDKKENTEVVIAPVISNLVATSTRPHRATISWDTNVKAKSFVWYSKTSPVDTSGFSRKIRSEEDHKNKITLGRLDANTKYYVIIKSINSAGTTTSSEVSFTTPAEIPVVVTDTTKPVLSNIQTLNGTTTSTVSWTTDEVSTGIVYYSTVTPLDINAGTTLSVSNTSLSTNHSIVLPGLTSGTTYRFIVKSTDASNNAVVSSEHSFITN
jgi:hypothetical protein